MRGELLRWLGKQLGIKEIQDWYQVPLDELSRKFPGIDNAFICLEVLVTLLKEVYPQNSWQVNKFVHSRPDLVQSLQKRSQSNPHNDCNREMDVGNQQQTQSKEQLVKLEQNPNLRYGQTPGSHYEESYLIPLELNLVARDWPIGIM